MVGALDVLGNLLDLAKKAGAETADALILEGTHLSASVRLGKLENLERSEAADIGLRVFIGKRQAVVSSSDPRAKSLSELAGRAVSMARVAPEDPFCGIAERSEVAKTYPALESADSVEYDAEKLIAFAKEAEAAAREVKGVTNSDGAGAGWGRSSVSIAASNGFSGTTRRTGYSLQATVLAGEGTGMQRDHEAASRVFAADLPSAAWVGRQAGERAVAKLNPRKMQTSKVPVFFDSRIAGSVVRTLLGAISGAAVARGTSFLKDKLGQKIFAEGITIVDDPHRPRGLRSRAFDAEGIMARKRKLVDAGVLTTWVMDLRSARQLQMQSTGHAARSPSGGPSPSPTNVYMEAGDVSLEALMRDVRQGFFVTETMGMGVNGVTGDYSQAASGFWIEDGRIVFPVSEMTIAGNLKDMFLNTTAANDLEFRYGVDAPTLRVDGMTVAGV
jgi:PmbA protein